MAKKRINRILNLETGVVTFEILGTDQKVTADCATLVGGKAVYDKLPEMAKRIVLHGANAKFGDSAADPMQDAAAQIETTIKQVMEGVWNTKGAGGTARVSILAEALAEATNKDLDEVVDKLDAMADEQKADLRKHPRIKALMDDIKAKRAAEKAKASKAGAKDAGGLEGLFAD